MDKYQLQTEINQETKLEIEFHTEVKILEDEIEKQKKKRKRQFLASLSVSGLVLLMMSLISFFFQSSLDWFLFVMIGIGGTLEFFWLSFGLRKRRKTLEEWNRIAVETKTTKINEG